jgi:signal transduction histidine kinase
MAMHNSNDISATTNIVFTELKKLDIQSKRCGVALLSKNSRTAQVYAAAISSDGEFHTLRRSINMTQHPSQVQQYESWLTQKNYISVLSGEELKSYYQLPFFHSSASYVPPEHYDHKEYGYYIPFSEGLFYAWTENPYSDNEVNILNRFKSIIDLTFRRFFDLQKAEAQAREAQIEGALERVRSRTMAMHRSEEIADIVGKIFAELRLLDLVLNRVLIWIFNDEERYISWWSANPEVESNAESYRVDYNEHPVFLSYLQAWQKRLPLHLYTLSGDTKKTWEDHLFTNTELSTLPMPVRKGMREEGTIFTTSTTSDYGLMMVGSFEPLTDANTDIIQRFGRVFQQSYTRYLDVQRAEAQAREAQIEASLERVRARTMAMQKSDELLETSFLLFQQIKELGDTAVQVSVGIIKEETGFVELSTTIHGHPLPKTYNVPIAEPYVMSKAIAAWKAKRSSLTVQITGQELKDYNEYRNSFLETKINFPEDTWIVNLVFFSKGWLSFSSNKEISTESFQLLERFAGVFNLTYTRFSDLQIAEAQAREAKIEAAMEKVRARAMAMQKPGELIEVAQLLRKEMGMLGVEELETSSIYIHDEVSGTTECWYAIQDVREQNRKLVTDYMNIQLNDTWVGREMLKFYTSDQKQISILMRGENRKEWINYCAQHSKVLQGYYGDVIPERTYHLLKFSNGYMGAASPGDISAESWELLKRATTVFSLAYTRFSDLQLAEANAKEAIKQSALDRIRADIASMRTIADLDKITPLIWNELTILGIPFIRCGVFIMDESQRLIHTFLSTPDGKAIAAFHLPYTTPGNISQVLHHWRNKENYIDHWDEKIFTEFADTLVKQGALTSADQYMKTLPAGGFYLHFLPFLQGMLYVGNTIQLNEDEIKLIQSVANAFSTAYARYEDFNKLEAAKQQVEKTLVDLKQAQTQLVQSEKMASLGELTAGIAHEIQNPLNFVNNFSDVSNELLDEMKAELAKGNSEDAMAIVEDVKQNLEKILHHGKRADAIVKGMLQHSRMSSGQKELTDINNLADEYLRLAYHGLRAKDKSFNAKFETDFDKRIGKINIIPQDIGRVLVNLMTNAFYAVSEKAKLSANSYEPMVIVTTKKIIDKVEIKVRDNGTGIHQKVLDKIFQPFFTTKPTGQGTGLGLSLAYDIIKAHGGELKVETKEGEGSEFIIQLPVT